MIPAVKLTTPRSITSAPTFRSSINSKSCLSAKPAEISAGGEVYPSKYLTIWQRQPDGSWKYITDGGNARPLR